VTVGVIVGVSVTVGVEVGVCVGVTVGVCDGGGTTMSMALAALPMPPFALKTGEVRLKNVVTNALTTFTENVQDTFGGMEALRSWMLLDPATATIVPPPHCPMSPLGVATTRGAVSTSLNPTPSSGVLMLGLVMVKVSAVGVLIGVDAGLNDLEIEGGKVGVPAPEGSGRARSNKPRPLSTLDVNATGTDLIFHPLPPRHRIPSPGWPESGVSMPQTARLPQSVWRSR
jgi:hypothetical protein